MLTPLSLHQLPSVQIHRAREARGPLHTHPRWAQAARDPSRGRRIPLKLHRQGLRPRFACCCALPASCFSGVKYSCALPVR